MKATKLFALALLIQLLFICEATKAMPSQDAFHTEIATLYNFQPHAATSEQITKKSGELDVFWKKIETNRSKYLAPLRAELRNTANPKFFFYDGSKLLLSLSQAKEDKQLALQAIARCDPRDIDSSDYLRTVHALATEGLDSSDAALNILAFPEFEAFVPQHALTLGQNYSLAYMLIVTDDAYYLDKAIARLETETNETALLSLLSLLWFTVTEKGDAAIAKAAENPETLAAVRQHAQKMQSFTAEINKGIKPAMRKALATRLNLPSTAGFAQIKAARRERMRSISDEALGDFQVFTSLMRAK